MSSTVASAISEMQGNGQPLPTSEQTFFESRFQRDFSRVQIHTGSKAAEAAMALEAKAFTVGQDVVFGKGRWQPESALGRRLIAHELTHTIQQQRSGQRRIQRETSRDEEVARSRSSPGGFAAAYPPLKISLYNFAIGGAELKAEHQLIIDELVRMNSHYAGLQFLIVGHTDETGDNASINEPLSNERAEAVGNRMAGAGVSLLNLRWRGELNPETSNATESGRSRNRRVDIYIASLTSTEGGESSTETPQGGNEGGRDEEGDFFCSEYPEVCGALIAAGLLAGAIAFCLANPEICLPIPLWPDPPDPDWPDDPDDDDPDDPEDLPCGHARMPHTVVDFPSGTDKGVSVSADPLTRCPPTNGIRGSRAKNDDNTWPTGWECIPPGQGRFWRRAHLLHGPGSATAATSGRHLHGPGDERWNIIITDGSINTLMSTRVENGGAQAVGRVHDQHQILFYDVEVAHFTGDYPRPYYGESVHMHVGTINPDTGIRSTLFNGDITSNVGRQPPLCVSELDDDTDTTGGDDGSVFAHSGVVEGPSMSAAPPGVEELRLPADAQCGPVSCGVSEYFFEAAQSFLGVLSWNEDFIREGIRRESQHVRESNAGTIRSQRLMAQVRAMGSGHLGQRDALALEQAIELTARDRVFRFLANADHRYRTPSIEHWVWGRYAR